jgi:hypothetical protein
MSAHGHDPEKRIIIELGCLRVTPGNEGHVSLIISSAQMHLREVESVCMAKHLKRID